MTELTTRKPKNSKPTVEEKAQAKKYDPGRDWSAFPEYETAKQGLRNYWYPVLWARKLKSKKPTSVKLCGEKIMLQRDAEGKPRALHDRCPHRGVRLSQGKQWWPGTVSCPYHGWTFDLISGDLKAAITDGPDSRMCGKAAVKTYPTEERLGMIWVYVGDEPPHPLKDQLPAELVNPPKYAVGGRMQDRKGDWRLYAENGFDEGHAKYLHRTSIWRIMKVMPTWNKIHIEKEDHWLYRVEDERFWEADYPGLGKWTNDRWFKIKPKQKQGKFMGNTGGGKTNAYIKEQDFTGFASISLPGVLRIAYPNFIHYEFYVPIDVDETKYVGVMIQFKSGIKKWLYYLQYLLQIRWMFHGNFSAQDHWMVEETNAPPERLYRPDLSLLEWRKLFTGSNPFKTKSEEETKNDG